MTAQVLEIKADVPDTQLRFSHPHRPFQDDYGYADRFLDVTVDLVSPGLNATVQVRTDNGDQLAEFLHRLAQDYAGWQGQRTWTSVERDLRLDARHLSRGTVELTWTARSPRRAATDRNAHWTAAITLYLEAGEQMRHLADDITDFLSQ